MPETHTPSAVASFDPEPMTAADLIERLTSLNPNTIVTFVHHDVGDDFGFEYGIGAIDSAGNITNSRLINFRPGKQEKDARP